MQRSNNKWSSLSIRKLTNELYLLSLIILLEFLVPLWLTPCIYDFSYSCTISYLHRMTRDFNNYPFSYNMEHSRIDFNYPLHVERDTTLTISLFRPMCKLLEKNSIKSNTVKLDVLLLIAYRPPSHKAVNVLTHLPSQFKWNALSSIISNMSHLVSWGKYYKFILLL